MKNRAQANDVKVCERKCFFDAAQNQIVVLDVWQL